MVELVIEANNLRPIGLFGGGSLAMHGTDCSLDLVRAWLPEREGMNEELLAITNLPLIPAATILIGQQNRFSGAILASSMARTAPPPRHSERSEESLVDRKRFLGR
ncbi:MAG: hypothetical protein Fur005_48630 [Roseiflexaceae bacterium]